MENYLNKVINMPFINKFEDTKRTMNKWNILD